jgi:hypothetical protein
MLLVVCGPRDGVLRVSVYLSVVSDACFVSQSYICFKKRCYRRFYPRPNRQPGRQPSHPATASRCRIACAKARKEAATFFNYTQVQIPSKPGARDSRRIFETHVQKCACMHKPTYAKPSRTRCTGPSLGITCNPQSHHTVSYSLWRRAYPRAPDHYSSLLVPSTTLASPRRV